jgi:DinB superfamily
MTADQSLAATAVHAWTLNVARAEKVFFGQTDEALRQEVAPGKNRLVYLWGHLIAVHDAMLPLIGIGPRLHPKLDQTFLTEADRSTTGLPSNEALAQLWREVHDALASGFARFTPADWTARHTAMTDDEFSANPLRNRLAVLLNRTAHLAYHLGQCALVSPPD